MKLKLLLALLFALGTPLAGAQITAPRPRPDGLTVIPQPARCEPLSGRFALSPDTVLCAAEAFTNEARLLRRQLQTATGLPLPLRLGPVGMDKAICLLQSHPTYPGVETYTLEVRSNQVTLRAAQPAGMFRATQTLLQLFPPEVLASAPATGVRWELPAVRVEDAPRFGWRGLMLDCSRTFQSLDYLKKTLDRMALYKLNVLHLHLTDDQGWRLELKKYPNLAPRAGVFPARFHEPPSHQGFYTQQQLRDLVAYAAERHILVVPEIEMPGHSQALLSVLPQLSCTGGPFEFFPYGQGPGITEDVLCAGQEQTFDFLRDVLEEVTGVFTSPYVHIGGDEVPRTRWQHCPHCQARMQAEGLKTEAELQSWFNQRIERILAAKGRRLVGWDEISEGGVSSQTIVMGWRGAAHAQAAAQSGHDVVLTPNTYCYFDLTYAASDSAHVFSYDPLAGLTPEAARHVLGLQASFWSHMDREPELVDRLLYPRLLTLAERAWAPDNRNAWPDYRRRLEANLPRLDQLGIHYEPLDLLGAVGEWALSHPANEVTNLEFDVSRRITNSGRYEVTVAYIKGKRPAHVRTVELLRGSEVVACDDHESQLGWATQRQTYRLRVPTVEGNGYHLRLTLDLAGGTNAYGKVFLLREPQEGTAR